MPKIKQNEKNKGKASILITLAAVVIIIAVVFGGVFYFIISTNAGGFAQKHRATIQKLPVFRSALPAAPDPLDPRYMTDRQIRDKYVEFREENIKLKEQLDEATRLIDEYKYYKDNIESLETDAENKLNELKERTAALDARELEINEMKKQLDELIAEKAGREAFIEYFERIDPENARSIYESLVKKKQTDEEIKKFAQIYAQMDEASAARIFEQLGNSKIDMIAETLMLMNRENSAAILEAMNPEFAALVTEKLNELYREN